MAFQKTSITDQVLALRAAADAPVVCGQWHAGFNTVKAAAEAAGLPLIGIWTNGDACSLCVKVEKNLLSTTFQEWMKTSNCVFWFGTSSDPLPEDKTTGKKWAKNDELSIYPFVRICVVRNGQTLANFAQSGNNMCKGKLPEVGAQNMIAKFEEILATVPPVVVAKPAPVKPSSKKKAAAVSKEKIIIKFYAMILNQNQRVYSRLAEVQSKQS